MKKITTSEVAWPFLATILTIFVLGIILIMVPYIIVLFLTIVVIWLMAATLAFLWNKLVSLIG